MKVALRAFWLAQEERERHVSPPAKGLEGCYFRKAKKTARTRQAKATRWFQWMDCPLKTKRTIICDK